MEINFDHRTAAHCENGVTSNLLRFYGYDYSEPLVFGLSASLYFVHLPFIRMSGFPVTSIRPLPSMIFTRATQMLGFKIQKKLFFIKRHAEEELNKLVDKGIPTGCIVGMYYLPYMPPEYRFPFNAHNICVIGREEDEYLVSDPVVSEKVRISANDLLLARFAHDGYPVLGLLYHIRSLPDSQPDMNLLVRRAILKNCYRMLREPGVVPFVGVNAFKYLGKRIPHFPHKYGERKAAQHLAQLIRIIEEIGTGGAGLRFIYSAFLQEAASITGIDRLNSFSQRLTEIGDDWRLFASEAGRICKNRSSEGLDYKSIGEHLISIGEQEKSFFIDLEKTLRS